MWAKDDQEPLDRSTGSDWPGQNLPGEGEREEEYKDLLECDVALKKSSNVSMRIVKFHLHQVKEHTLARSRSACLRCLQNKTEDPECGLVTGSPYTSSRIRTPDTRIPFSSHTSIVGSIQSIQPHESAAENTHLFNVII